MTEMIMINGRLMVSSPSRMYVHECTTISPEGRCLCCKCSPTSPLQSSQHVSLEVPLHEYVFVLPEYYRQRDAVPMSWPCCRKSRRRRVGHGRAADQRNQDSQSAV